MRLNAIYLLVTGLALFIVGCGPQVLAANSASGPATLNVFAAASLTESFTELAAEFEASHPGVDIVLNLAGSQTLRLQIEQGARADVFASANTNHARALIEAGLIREPVIFAENRLVVIVPGTNPASIKSLADLARPNQKLILASANVPAGRYARDVLEKLSDDLALGQDYAMRVLNNLASEEDSVKGVLAKVRLGEADAGIVYASDLTPTVTGELNAIPIPASYNVQATYPLAIATDSLRPDLARQFVDFVLSPRGQTLLADHGFQPLPSIALLEHSK